MITITNIRPGTTGVARSADMTALFPGGAKVNITLAAGEWQPGTAVTEWVPCGPSLDYWVSDPSAVPEGMADELAAAGQEALRAVDADLYDAILAVRDANAITTEHPGATEIESLIDHAAELLARDYDCRVE